MTFPLPTLAPTVDSNGITALSYSDILASLVASFQQIYGPDTYLGPDSQDGQWLAIIAQAIYDCGQTAVFVFNNYSPASAIGAGLSSVVKINGLQREIPSQSTVDLDIVGVAGTPILNGIVGDDQGLGTQWALPPSVTIPAPSGTITVTATCTTEGDVDAAPGTLTQMLTPTPGWQSVTNPAAAVAGAPVETDAALRRRQSQSTAISAESVLDAIYAQVANVVGVQRVAAYENDTASTDGNGVPSHTIVMIVEGGDAMSIAQAIASKKTPGTGTYGNISEVVTDPLGISSTINFQTLELTTISVLVFLTALSGYVASTGTSLQSAIVQWLNTLDIGEDSYLSRLYAPAGLMGDAATTATGLTQAQLDPLGNTYNVTGIAQARADMDVTGGPYGAGSTVIDVVNAADYSAGQVIYIVLNDGSFWKAALSNVTGTALTFAPAIPGGKTVQNGALVYVVGDLSMAFDEATQTATANVNVQAS